MANGVVWMLCAGLWLSGCGPEPTPKVNPPKKPVKAPSAPAKPAEAPPSQAAPAPGAQAAPAAGAQTAPAATPQEPVYTYVAGNRRDPFRSIIVSRGKEAETSLMHPLQQYAVKDLKLVAVVWGQLGAGAMLQTPDGKGYTVYVGTAVGNRDGVVRQIKPDQVVVKERYTDIFGERKEESVVLDLHLPEEGLK